MINKKFHQIKQRFSDKKTRILKIYDIVSGLARNLFSQPNC